MKLRLSALLLIPALLQACGGTQVIPGQASGDTSQYKAAHISEIVISSAEGNEDELANNKKMESYARSKLEEVMAEKHFVSIDEATAKKSPALVFKFKSSVNYGIRAARMAVPFTFAGTGTVSSQFEVTDSISKKLIYSASAESNLKAGAFGGGMDSTIEKNIDELLEAFDKHSIR